MLKIIPGNAPSHGTTLHLEGQVIVLLEHLAVFAAILRPFMYEVFGGFVHEISSTAQ